MRITDAEKLLQKKWRVNPRVAIPILTYYRSIFVCKC